MALRLISYLPAALAVAVLIIVAVPGDATARDDCAVTCYDEAAFVTSATEAADGEFMAPAVALADCETSYSYNCGWCAFLNKSGNVWAHTECDDGAHIDETWDVGCGGCPLW